MYKVEDGHSNYDHFPTPWFGFHGINLAIIFSLSLSLQLLARTKCTKSLFYCEGLYWIHSLSVRTKTAPSHNFHSYLGSLFQEIVK